MVLYFKTKPNKNGNTKQLTINTDKNTIKKGFFLFGWTVDAVTVTPRQLDDIAKQAEQQTAKKG